VEKTKLIDNLKFKGSVPHQELYSLMGNTCPYFCVSLASFNKHYVRTDKGSTQYHFVKVPSVGSFDPAFVLFTEKYYLGDSIGLGSTAVCYNCYERLTGKEFACKVIDKEEINKKFKGCLSQFEAEIEALLRLQKQYQHPNIIHLENVYIAKNKIYMIMEKVYGGELFDYIASKKRLSEKEASCFLRKIISGVAYMHSHGIIHRDLKPENILCTVNENIVEIKIIDFGLCKQLNQSNPLASSFLGTRGYFAPEMLQRENYGPSVDVWAIGVIAYILLCGRFPFDDDCEPMTINDAKQKFRLTFPERSGNLSMEAKDLLSHLLDTDQSRRYTAEEALRHPWVQGKTTQMDNMLRSPKFLRKLSMDENNKKRKKCKKCEQVKVLSTRQKKCKHSIALNQNDVNNTTEVKYLANKNEISMCYGTIIGRQENAIKSV